MKEKRYFISDAAKLLNVETHALRYWEEELNLTVRRNEMGHRYYTPEDIRHLEKIRDYKENGYQLKEIKQLLPNHFLNKHSVIIPMENEYHIKQQKMERLQEILTDIMRNVLEEQRQEIEKEISDEISAKVIKQMDYLLRLQEEEQEKHFKQLDEKLRNFQQMGKEKTRIPFFRVRNEKKASKKRKAERIEGWVPNVDSLKETAKE